MIPIAVLAMTLHFRMIQNVPVATVPTNFGPMNLIIDSGAAHTFFSLAVSRNHDTVCVFGTQCVPTMDANQYVPMFRKFSSQRHLQVDGMVGEDVLSHLGKVTIDYQRQVVLIGD